MQIGTPDFKFSYADDIGVHGIRPTTGNSAAAAQREVDNLFGWARYNAVAFDSEKSEVVQFPKRYKDATAGIKINGKYIEPAPHIRWLGVHLDPRIEFRHHVVKWCTKAMKAAQFMKRINSFHRGANPGLLIGAVNASIVPLASYGSDVWWPGLTRRTLKGNVTPPTATQCDMIDKVILTGLRAALPVLRTTPNAALHREGGIPPAKILLEK